ncbi:hypothetical protein [Persephonella sp.]
MSKTLFELRRLYFVSLYTSFLYISLLLIIIRKNVKPAEIGIFDQIIFLVGSLIPAIFFILKRVKNIYIKNFYKKILFAGHIPLVIGFLMSLIWKNYLYFLIMFPVFILAYLIIIPTEKAVSRGKNELPKTD